MSQIGWGKVHRLQTYINNYRQLKKTGSGRSLPQERVHQLVFQHQIISPENIHTSNIVQVSPVFIDGMSVALLEEVYHGVGFGVSKAQARASDSLFLLLVGLYVELSAISPPPCLSACCHLLCHENSGPNL